MVKSSNISFQYLGESSIQFPDLNCARGEQVLLLGKSGCGKTTLLHILGGLRSPSSGEIMINERSLGTLSTAEMDKFRGQNIGVIFQTSHFVKALSVNENLLIAQMFAGLSKDQNRIDELLKRLNISHKANARPNQLSQGEQQRLAIARALINRPSIILADEPTSALDDDNTDEVINLLIEEASAVNATLLVVTHDTRLKSVFPKRIEL